MPVTRSMRRQSCCVNPTARRKRWPRRSAGCARCWRRPARRTGATELRVSRDEAERMRFWAGRKAAFPAAGRLSPDYYCMDGTIPRKRIGEMLEAIQEMESKYALRCINVFHAGDGNLHPLILFDANRPGELHRAEAFGADILELSVALGGTVTGEHGVGIEKINQMCSQFARPELAMFFRVKAAFDPVGLLNPGLDCSIRARPFRRSIVAPSMGACGSAMACCPIPNCRGSDGQDRHADSAGCGTGAVAHRVVAGPEEIRAAR